MRGEGSLDCVSMDFPTMRRSRFLYRHEQEKVLTKFSLREDAEKSRSEFEFMARRLCRSIAVSAGCAMLAFVACPIQYASGEGRPGLSRNVVFADYTPLSSNAEIIRRMLSPLAAAQIPAALARAGTHLSDQPVNLAQEKFIMYVPAREPAE